jgi:hypothetical protein
VRRARDVKRRLVWSAGFPLAGGAGVTWFVHWSQQHWWAGPSVVAAVVLVLLVLWHW